MIVDIPTGNRLAGFYRGQVVKHCANGLCKIWVPGVYKEEYRYQPDLLPDAEIAVGTIGGTFGDADIHYPNIGAIVWLFFANGDQNYPVVFAISAGGSEASKNYSKAKDEQSIFDDDKYDIVEASKLDLKKKSPVSRRCYGNIVEETSFSGKKLDVASKDISRDGNCAKPYSYTMHVFNYLKQNLFKAHPLSKAYYVYSTGDSKNPKLVVVGSPNDLTTDDLSAFNGDNNVVSCSSLGSKIEKRAFKNYFQDECIGILCILEVDAKSESAFVNEAMAYFSGNTADKQNPYDGKTVWDNYQTYKPKYPRPTAYSEAQKMKSIFISMDQTDKTAQLEICRANLVDLYICSSKQYGIVPEMFDKAFEGEKTYYCPLKEIPLKTLPDIDMYNVNLILLQPNRLSCSSYRTQYGSKTAIDDLYTESHMSYEQNAGKSSKQRYAQMLKDGNYDTIRNEPSSFIEEHSEEDMQLGKFHIARYYGTEDSKKTLHKLSVADFQSYSTDSQAGSIGTGSYVYDLLADYLPYPTGLALSSYVLGNEPHYNAASKLHEISNSNFIDIQAGTQKEVFTSCYYPHQAIPCMVINSNICKDVADMSKPQQELSVEYICGKAGVDKFVDTKMYAFKNGRAKLSVWSTDDFELTLIDPKLPGTWSYVKMDREGSILISSSNSITLDAPTINFNGQQYNATFKSMQTKSGTIDTTADQQNITATTTHKGDATINGNETVTIDSNIHGISFAGHAHTDSQDGTTSPPF